ncbi:hypothetical protein EV182_000867 [Spiromyces aspiralis]|uniref:Uncharacterized protein n=1 Tax=Spiromyces aspiralis TaxID=68401 RepID=A0ACC1HK76_9FUNG|nr:hypothetical protein EV182_000867 [Spiromyces aspiralis]
MTQEMWVFGYGSLIWKVDFPVEKSHDHRGTPEKPGRVVTLIPYEEWKDMEDEHHLPEDDVCWGMVYKVESGREVEDGYTVHVTSVYREGSYDMEEIIVRDAIVYIGTTQNESFAGPTKQAKLAEIIANATGPSGPNVDYLLNLCQALRLNHPHGIVGDSHLTDLEARVLEIMKQRDEDISKWEKKAEDKMLKSLEESDPLHIHGHGKQRQL